MPITFNGIDYLTTAEAMQTLNIRSRETWSKIAADYGLLHTTQLGKSNRYLWKKSEVEALLKPIPRD